VQFIAAIAVLLPWPVQAQNSNSGTTAPTRPSIMFNRWEEDWSVLADPRVPREPLDSLKYIPLSPYDPKTYLSFGGNLRERFEANNAANFGVGANHNQNYVISRSEAHADLRIADQVQVFVQLQSDFAPWKTILTPVDRDRLDLEQAFALLTEPIGDGTARIRLGRQQFNFDLQRFVSVRDGPNVRQSWDAAWADYETGPWKFIALYSRPVQVLDDRAFDDYSSSSQTFSVARVQRKLSDTTTLSGYYAHFTQANARFVNATGDERREIFDVRFNGNLANVERMDIHQSGVSRHLRILSEAGFVQVRPDGPKRLYSLRPEPFRELDSWVTRYRVLWESRLDRFAAALHRKQKAHPAARKKGAS